MFHLITSFPKKSMKFVYRLKSSLRTSLEIVLSVKSPRNLWSYEVSKSWKTHSDPSLGAVQTLSSLIAAGFFNTHQKRIVELAAKHRLPGMYPEQEFMLGGGLMTYAISISDYIVALPLTWTRS
jgi:hypothetical protein